MKRYQLYLNPHSVSIIDEVEEYTDISRSALIRMVVDSVAYNVTRVLAKKAPFPKTYPHMDSLMGTLKVKKKGKVNFSERKDSRYYKD